MSAVHNEQTKLLATALNNVAVAYVVVGFVTPLTAMSFGVASAPRLEPAYGVLRRSLALHRGRPTLGRAVRTAEPQTMSSGEIFVIFVIPGVTLTVAYIAMLANERAVKRARERSE